MPTRSLLNGRMARIRLLCLLAALPAWVAIACSPDRITLPERPRPEPRAKPGLTEIVSPIITITPEEDGGPAEIPAEEELPKVLNGSIVTRLDNAFIGNG